MALRAVHNTLWHYNPILPVRHLSGIIFHRVVSLKNVNAKGRRCAMLVAFCDLNCKRHEGALQK